MAKSFKPTKDMMNILKGIFPAAIPEDIILVVLEYLDLRYDKGFFFLLLHASGSVHNFVREHYTSRNFKHKFSTFIGGKLKECTMEYWFMVSILEQIEWKPTIEQKQEHTTLVPKSKIYVYSWNKCLNPKCDKEMSTTRFLKSFQERYGKYFIENTEKKNRNSKHSLPNLLTHSGFSKTF